MRGHGSGFRAPEMDVVDEVEEPPATPSRDAAKISAVFCCQPGSELALTMTLRSEEV
jgi:hypothetical protein